MLQYPTIKLQQSRNNYDWAGKYVNIEAIPPNLDVIDQLFRAQEICMRIAINIG
jgi:hypothetical protein